jgi:curved DNA-binding protein CbpA
MQPDPYEQLGISRQASSEDIKRAYFQQVRAHPPEREPERFRVIREAYDRLRTPERRTQTDMFLLQPPPETPSRRAPSFDLTLRADDLVAIALEQYYQEQVKQEAIRLPELS